MSFWDTIFFSVQNQVNKILERESFTLEDLLLQDELLQECMSQNPRLLKYLSQPEVLQKLFQLIINPPEKTPQSSDKQQRFPYVACQLLTCETWVIWEKAFNQTEQSIQLLRELFSFLNKDPPLPISPSNHFATVVNKLLESKTKEILDFVLSEANFLDRLLVHIGNSSILSVLLKLLHQANDIEMKPKIENRLLSESFVERLIEKFVQSTDNEECKNIIETLEKVANVFSGILPKDQPSLLNPNFNLNSNLHSSFGGFNNLGFGNLSHLNNMNNFNFNPNLRINLNVPRLPTPPSELFYSLISEPIIRSILASITKDSSKPKSEGLTLLIKIIGLSGDLNEKAQPLVSKFFDVLLQHLHLFCQLVEATGTNNNTKGSIGFECLKVVEFLTAFVETNCQQIQFKLLELGFFKTCLDLFFQYKLNNIYHNLVLRLFLFLIQKSPEPVKVALLSQSPLVDRIIEAYKELKLLNPAEVSQRGYMGHLMLISNAINEIASNSPLISAILENKNWSEIEEHLIEMRQVFDTPIGGPKPTEDPFLAAAGDDFSALLMGHSSQQASLNNMNGGFQNNDSLGQENQDWHHQFIDGSSVIEQSYDEDDELQDEDELQDDEEEDDEDDLNTNATTLNMKNLSLNNPYHQQ